MQACHLIALTLLSPPHRPSLHISHCFLLSLQARCCRRPAIPNGRSLKCTPGRSMGEPFPFVMKTPNRPWRECLMVRSLRSRPAREMYFRPTVQTHGKLHCRARPHRRWGHSVDGDPSPAWSGLRLRGEPDRVKLGRLR